MLESGLRKTVISLVKSKNKENMQYAINIVKEKGSDREKYLLTYYFYYNFRKASGEGSLTIEEKSELLNTCFAEFKTEIITYNALFKNGPRKVAK